MYANGPAILFEDVKNYDMPVLGNAFGSDEKIRNWFRNFMILRRLDKEL